MSNDYQKIIEGINNIESQNHRTKPIAQYDAEGNHVLVTLGYVSGKILEKIQKIIEPFEVLYYIESTSLYNLNIIIHTWRKYT